MGTGSRLRKIVNLCGPRPDRTVVGCWFMGMTVGIASLAASEAVGQSKVGTTRAMPRNNAMIAQIERTPVRYPYSFIMAGDTGFVPNKEGDAVFLRLLARMDQLKPKPVFFVNLGDFAGPGTRERHEHYLQMIQRLSMPSICVMGNHEVDDSSGQANFESIVGPGDFRFAYGNTLFLSIRCFQRPSQHHGPEKVDLVFLEESLKADKGRHPVKVVLMHMPPNMQGHYAPHAEPMWAFTELEPDFLRIARSQKVTLICSGHITGYDRCKHKGIQVIVSGGGGGAVNKPPYDRIFENSPPKRAGFMHFVQITVQKAGKISGRVFRVSGNRIEPDPNYDF